MKMKFWFLILAVGSIIHVSQTSDSHESKEMEKKEDVQNASLIRSERSFRRYHPKFYHYYKKQYPQVNWLDMYNIWKNIHDKWIDWMYYNKNRPTSTSVPTSSTAVPTKRQTTKRELTYDEWLDRWYQEQEEVECGLQDIEPIKVDLRIVGGTTAVPGSWPWMVSLRTVGQHFCGGILISKQWVLSSAHCFLFMPGMDDPSLWEIQLGRFDPSSDVVEPETTQRFNISGEPIFYDSIDIEKFYEGYPLDNDVVLLKMDRPTKITPWVKPVCLPEPQEDPEDREKCVIAGYGQIGPNVGKAVKLKQAIVPIVGFERCQKLEGYAELLTSRMICAGFEYGGVDACKMDSGGPLQCFLNGRWIASGITSWGDAGGTGCAKALRPGVYTRVTSYIGWIKTMMYENYMDTQKT